MRPLGEVSALTGASPAQALPTTRSDSSRTVVRALHVRAARGAFNQAARSKFVPFSTPKAFVSGSLGFSCSQSQGGGEVCPRSPPHPALEKGRARSLLPGKEHRPFLSLLLSHL